MNIPEINSLLDTILEEVSGKYAYDWISRISGYHRMKSNSEYNAIILRMKDELERIGYKHIEHEIFPADGKSTAWNWKRTKQWEVHHAELCMISPEHKRLCSFEDLPLSLVSHSLSVNTEAEVIDLGKGDEESVYEEIDINGKIVLISGSAYVNHKKYMKKGAIGAIIYPDIDRTGLDHDLVIYDSLMETAEEEENAGFAFSVTFEQAYKIRQLLQNGPVFVKVDIQTELLEGNFETLSAKILGSDEPEKEILIFGHLCHPNPSANDNASGAAAVLDIARSIKRLIEKNKLQHPKYTIRFLWAPEYMGTIIWTKKHENLVKKCLSMINLDMVGLSLQKGGQPLRIICESVTNPSWFQIIVPYLAEIIEKRPNSTATHGERHPFFYTFKPFDGGSDHTIFADPYFGVPTIFLGGNDPFYHSSKDVVGNCDPTRLKRVSSLALLMTFLYATEFSGVIKAISPLIFLNINRKISQVFQLKTSKGDHGVDGARLLDIMQIHLMKQIDKLQIEYQSFVKHYVEKRIKVEKSLFDFNIGEIEPLTEDRFEMLIKGPFPNYILYKLAEKKEFKEFLSITQSEFVGSLLEFLYLLTLNYSISEIWGFLCIEYGVLLDIDMIKQLIEVLIEEKIIQKTENKK